MRDTLRAAGRALRWLDVRPDAQVRLFLFAHAGGGASSFRDWAPELPPWIEPIGVQPPGRENRLGEPPFDRMQPLAAEIAAAITPLLDLPAVFYGVSMGARVGLAVSQVLQADLRPSPAALFVASSRAPRVTLPVPGWNESDDRLVAYLRSLGGTAASIWDHPELMALQLPIVRADLTVVATCPPAPTPIDIPIVGFVGDRDPFCPPERFRPWAAETRGSFEYHEVPGGHFFPASSRELVRAAVVRRLGQLTGR
jgi:surfactin synthase thioesterase subunit